jgi:uncharacterized protein
VKLRVDDISADVRDLAFAEPEREINRALASDAMQEYRVTGPVHVVISYYRAGTEVFMSGEITVATTASCARCAEEFAGTEGRPFRYVLAPLSIGDGADPDLRGEELEYSLYDGEEIDLTPLIREQVFLALTERPLCREDCRGLCPRCGANLNQSRCGCSVESFDPRLAVLRSLKVGRRS